MVVAIVVVAAVVVVVVVVVKGGGRGGGGGVGGEGDGVGLEQEIRGGDRGLCIAEGLEGEAQHGCDTLWCVIEGVDRRGAEECEDEKKVVWEGGGGGGERDPNDLFGWLKGRQGRKKRGVRLCGWNGWNG
jgi:hypothetical protein